MTTATRYTRDLGLRLDPFHLVRQRIPGWNLAFAQRDGVMGLCDVPERVIWIHLELDEHQRRCMIVHEVVHAERIHDTNDPVHEQETQIETARRLIRLPELRRLATPGISKRTLAASLHVDLDTLETRIRHLNAANRRMVDSLGITDLHNAPIPASRSRH